jgi:hypothetical protein
MRDIEIGINFNPTDKACSIHEMPQGLEVRILGTASSQGILYVRNLPTRLMIRRLLAAIALAAIVTFSPQQLVNAKTHTTAASTSLAMFDTEAAAAAHCPRDTVVWLNIPSGIYHEKGMRWYGRTKHGSAAKKPAPPVIATRGTGSS